MKEKIQEIYREKSTYYLELLDEMEKLESLRYLIINFLIPDDNPGDMDIIIGKKDHVKIEKVLIKNGFKFYYNYNTNQYLWNKYVPNIGYIQFHIYVDFCFYGKRILKFEDIYTGDKIPDYKMEYLLFLLESFFKNEFKVNKFRAFDKINFEKNNNHRFHQITIFIEKSYRNSTKSVVSGFDFFKTNHIFYFNYLGILLLKKLKRLISLNRNTCFVVLAGVDGSGKSTIIQSLISVSNKGGVFSREYYFGLKNSFINKMLKRLKKNNSEIKINDDDPSKETNGGNKTKGLLYGSFTTIIALLYWIEYNVKWIVLRNNLIIPRNYLFIDRTYLDLIYYHNSRMIRDLFLKYSFKPDYFVLLVGNPHELAKRKSEYNVTELDKQQEFYWELFSSSSLKQKISIDTTTTDINDVVFSILNRLNFNGSL